MQSAATPAEAALLSIRKSWDRLTMRVNQGSTPCEVLCDEGYEQNKTQYAQEIDND